MEAGSTKSWRELIKPLTVQKLEKLSATPFLEFFEPLHTWIADDNLEKNLHVGWTSPDRKFKCDVQIQQDSFNVNLNYF